MDRYAHSDSLGGGSIMQESVSLQVQRAGHVLAVPLSSCVSPHEVIQASRPVVPRFEVGCNDN